MGRHPVYIIIFPPANGTNNEGPPALAAGASMCIKPYASPLCGHQPWRSFFTATFPPSADV